jgi:hypothetical protein
MEPPFLLLLLLLFFSSCLSQKHTHHGATTFAQKFSVGDATIWSMTLELSIMLLEASFTLIYNAYWAVITYADHQLIIIMC